MSTKVRRSGLGALLGLAASACFGCTEGPGRPPVFPPDASVSDAEVIDMATPIDAGDTRDASVRDVPVTTLDAGPQPQYPFTGVFGVLNSSDLVFAREVDGRVHIVVGGFPYSYTGTIDAEGNVDATGVELGRSGCLDAHIRGQYGRFDATFALEHQTCNDQNAPLSSRMSGAFFSDFDMFRSGVYHLIGEVLADPDNCFSSPGPNFEMWWAVSFVSDGRVMVFAVDDVVSGNATSFGTILNNSYTFDATQRLGRDNTSPSYVMSGEFMRISLNDPLTISSVRSVFNPDNGCAFQIRANGERSYGP